jgi:hypothetical protein
MSKKKSNDRYLLLTPEWDRAEARWYERSYRKVTSFTLHPSHYWHQVLITFSRLISFSFSQWRTFVQFIAIKKWKFFNIIIIFRPFFVANDSSKAGDTSFVLSGANCFLPLFSFQMVYQKLLVLLSFLVLIVHYNSQTDAILLDPDVPQKLCSKEIHRAFQISCLVSKRRKRKSTLLIFFVGSPATDRKSRKTAYSTELSCKCSKNTWKHT